jgi:hypothetical protein
MATISAASWGPANGNAVIEIPETMIILGPDRNYITYNQGWPENLPITAD